MYIPGYCKYNYHMNTVEKDEPRGTGIRPPRDPWKARLDKRQLEPNDQLPGPDAAKPNEVGKVRRKKLFRDTVRWHELRNRRPLEDEDGG
jgi:hypothetical protein